MDSYGSHCTKPTERSRPFCKPQTKFLVTLFATIVMVCGKVNFTNLSRYSDLNERTYHRQYQHEFEFAAFNQALVSRASRTGATLLAVMACSFIAKRGKASSEWMHFGMVGRVALQSD